MKGFDMSGRPIRDDPKLLQADRALVRIVNLVLLPAIRTGRFKPSPEDISIILENLRGEYANLYRLIAMAQAYAERYQDDERWSKRARRDNSNNQDNEETEDNQ